MGSSQEGGASFFSRQAMLLTWLAYPGSLSLNPWDWKDGQKSGAVQEKGLGPRWEGAHPLPTPPPSHRLPNGKGDTLNVFPGESTRGFVGSFCRVKSGLGDVIPLLVCAGREAQAVAVCYPFPTLDTF